jgi:hypothetical protein
MGNNSILSGDAVFPSKSRISGWWLRYLDGDSHVIIEYITELIYSHLYMPVVRIERRKFPVYARSTQLFDSSTSLDPQCQGSSSQIRHPFTQANSLEFSCRGLFICTRDIQRSIRQGQGRRYPRPPPSLDSCSIQRTPAMLLESPLLHIFRGGCSNSVQCRGVEG